MMKHGRLFSAQSPQVHGRTANHDTNAYNSLFTIKCPSDDPARGNVSEILVPYGYPEILVVENSIVRHRSGPWNGLRFSGTPQLKPNPMYTFEFVFNEEEIFYRYHVLNSSMLTRLVVAQNGDIQRFAWINRTQSWIIYLTVNTDNCERYALCGANGICSIDSSPVCNCLNGFVPNVLSEWEMMDWSSGCLRRTPLNCSGDGFQRLSGVKLPETKTSWFNKSMNLDECRNTCLKNCNCTAFSNLDIRNGGSGCLLWFGDLIDTRIFVDNKPDIYVRMAASELDNGGGVKINAKSNVKKRIIVSIVLSTGILILLALFWYIWKKKQQKKVLHAGNFTGIVKRGSNNNPVNEDLDLPLFCLDTLTLATNNFSADNKLGEGGFGPVYKAWKLFTDGRPLELVSESIVETCNLFEALRSIHVGLLCVQENPEDRPTMSYVVLMLSNEDALPRPKQPGFFTERDLIEATYTSSSSQNKPYSANECSISMMEAR
ncbi:hypothetical protein SADUNF_Sadunf11G0093100 [Salix dunnii]|uniref:Apple domain-containing protein n=1 Tax=Salix dunnii TaxID=1413687 RepID=A0A835MTI4_9ROSI|nr:hypothetical protein SADUNF_Sadunf11G0093100 [Salix dunnii]